MRSKLRPRTADWLPVALLYGAFGCGDPLPPVPPAASEPPDANPTCFDPGTAGTVRGRVCWEGELPDFRPTDVRSGLGVKSLAPDNLIVENPNLPVIDAPGRGVRGAVVFLRGVNAARSRPWDHPPVVIEHRDFQIHVRQGERDGRTGFVRRGAAVEMVSRQTVFHSLSARGAAFFTLAFPDPDQPLSRRLPDRGLVELSSAAGHFWMRAYLFVDDHPYYTWTDAAGRFELAGVPPGDYEVVCWLPNWLDARHERDPETGAILRFFFRPPVEQVRPTSLPERGSREVAFMYSIERFRAAP